MLQELEEAEIEMDILQKEHALQESPKDSKEHQLPCLDSIIFCPYHCWNHLIELITNLS